ncbi:FixH family protein [Roseicitreum antarcticum]|uniref:Nitrogen fixation protein FixH n=1 Tax=Roseicitreum antarcticum TaxID=564137 RepID=A0A1H2RM71_9RHOB|nr:FixH family protein [Roseicitreum antarcticum]SDW20556.1 Nitrogen fixation protein FixH [Roseicitreum antarcticum]
MTPHDTDYKPGGKPLTGFKVLMIAVGAFGVIITVNLILAYNATRTFPGLEVQNSYVASQNFNEELAAQLALNWDVSATVTDDVLTLAFTDATSGAPVQVAALDATLGRATHVRDDQTPDFSYAGGMFTAPVDLAPGNWNVRLLAQAPDGTEFRQRVVLRVPR